MHDASSRGDASDAEEALRFQGQLLDAVGEAVIATDLDGIVRYWGPTAERLYGWSPQQALGRRVTDLNVVDDNIELARDIMAQVRQGRTWTGRFEVRRADGSRLPVLVTDAPFYDATGQVAGIIGSSTDITDLVRSEQLLARHAEQQTAIAELGRYALSADKARAVAAEAERSIDELLGEDVRVRVRWSADGHVQPPADHDTCLRVEIGPATDLVVTCGGEATLEEQDQEFVRAMAHVVSAAVRHQITAHQLEHLATHDALTGLPNRTLFVDRLEQARASAQRTGKRYAVLLLNLDGYKLITDGLSHDVGEEVLRLVADRLQGNVRPADTVARFGGDEYAVLCPDIRDDAATDELTTRIQASLQAPVVTSTGHELTTTASLGVVLGDEQSTSAALLRDVDAAMHRAKDNGRNRLEWFDAEIQDKALTRLRVANTARDALANGGVDVHYHPIVRLATGKIVGVEALARLHLPSGETISPAEFIPVAEELGLIRDLGAQVLRRACGDAAQWLSHDPAFLVSVNLSPRQFTDDELVDTVAEVVAESGIPADNLWLEITESALLAGPNVHSVMARLRQLGVHLAIDDFGTGYSSLAHLRHTPADALKIDRSFVAGLVDDPHDRALVVAAIELARTFGLVTIAEGVETDQQWEHLAALGSELGQGYLWSRPVPAAGIARLLDHQRAATLPQPG